MFHLLYFLCCNSRFSVFYIPAFQLICCFSVTKLCLTLWPHELQHARLPCPSHLLEFAQTHVHWVDCAIQPSNPLSSPFSPALNLSQHQGLFQWVSSLHQVTTVLELPTNNGVLILSCCLPRISIMAKLIFLSFWYLTDRCAEYHLPSWIWLNKCVPGFKLRAL